MSAWQIVFVGWIVASILLAFGLGYLARHSITDQELEREREEYEKFKANLETARQNRAASASSPEEVRMLLGTWDRGEDRRRAHSWDIQPERRTNRERRHA